MVLERIVSNISPANWTLRCDPTCYDLGQLSDHWRMSTLSRLLTVTRLLTAVQAVSRRRVGVSLSSQLGLIMNARLIAVRGTIIVHSSRQRDHEPSCSSAILLVNPLQRTQSPSINKQCYLFIYLLLRQMAARHTVIQTRHSYTKI